MMAQTLPHSTVFSHEYWYWLLVIDPHRVVESRHAVPACCAQAEVGHKDVLGGRDVDAVVAVKLGVVETDTALGAAQGGKAADARGQWSAAPWTSWHLSLNHQCAVSNQGMVASHLTHTQII